MGARGPHDDFETAKKVIRAAFSEYALTQDIEEVGRKYISDELEYVSRMGTFHGTEEYFSQFRVQSGNWQIEGEVEDVLDAGEGALIVLTKNFRIDKESGEVAWKAWPAIVMRVLDGKMVFNEGYIDRRQALAEYGIEQG